MLDEDFISAYRHGIVLKCADGIARRIFPRIFTYSADYPEKCVLLRIFFKKVELLINLQGINCYYQRHGLVSMSPLFHTEKYV
jgi:hypothetical protein